MPWVLCCVDASSWLTRCAEQVCLSLLGTWSGSPEMMWSPDASLLQVLLSIQVKSVGESPWLRSGMLRRSRSKRVALCVRGADRSVVGAFFDGGWLEHDELLGFGVGSDGHASGDAFGHLREDP